MTQYVKFINENSIEYPPKNKGNIINYNINYDLLIKDGYKPFIEVEKPETIRLYHIEYNETNTIIEEVIVYDETQEEAEERIKQEEKQRKISEIEFKINELNEMIINELRLGNIQNIEIYNDVIKGLETTKANL